MKANAGFCYNKDYCEKITAILDISINTNYYYYNNFFLCVLKTGQKVRQPISEAYIINLLDGLLIHKGELQ